MQKLIILIIACISINLISQESSKINQLDANGLKQGKWIKYYDNGKIKYEGNFINDKPVGLLKRYYETGTLKAEMTFLPNDLVKAKIFHENGKIASEGNYINTIKDSTWNYYSNQNEGQLRIKEDYLNGRKNGKSFIYTDEGYLSQVIAWQNGVRHGPWQTYFSDSTVRTETMYREGKLHGVFNSYYTNGRIDITGKYNNGRRNGDWYKYDYNGKLQSKTIYENGVPTNRDELIENFMKEYEENMRNSHLLKDPEKEPPIF